MSTRHSASIYLVQPKPLPEKTPTAPEPIATPTLPHQLRRVLTASADLHQETNALVSLGKAHHF
ncbi:hypothetical protein [Microcoleus sp. B7-D4]|uniref:hypothetical protein n=1 Tax=Microcoleus sp. B7-D4 TaxID=2818696 RepID=UPI002FD6288E